MRRSAVPRLSIVIPALGAWEPLEATLVSVLANRPADAEIIVALGQAYDDPYGLAGEIRFLTLRPNASTVDAWNEAFVVCQAPVMHLLACGAIVSEGWTDVALGHFDDARVAAVAPLVTSLDQQYVTTGGWRYSVGGAASNFAAGRPAEAVREAERRWMGPHGAAAFYRRSALKSARPAFDASLGEDLAPLDLALRLRAAGLRAVLEPLSRVALAELPAVLDPGHQALLRERLFWRHAANDGVWKAVGCHVGAVASEFFRACPRPWCGWQLMQRACGLISSRPSAGSEFQLEPWPDGVKQPEATYPSHRFHPSHPVLREPSKVAAATAEARVRRTEA